MTRSRPSRTPDEADAATVREAGVKLLARREHSVRELRAKLARRGYPDAAIDQALAELRAGNLVSDERFTESFVNLHMARGEGPVKLRQALRERGVEDGLIERYLPGDAELWRQQARSACEHRFGAEPPADRRDWLRRARFLQRRGFTGEQVRAVLGRGPDED